jgi:hypothetical protein
LNIFFDVDYTILAMDGSLRPRTHEVFQEIKDRSHDLYIWSGVGLRHAEVRQHKLEPYVSDIFVKPLGKFETALTTFRIPVTPDFVIDDYPEIVYAFGGFAVKAYYLPNQLDRELDKVLQAILDFAAEGHSSDPGYRAKHNPA